MIARLEEDDALWMSQMSGDYSLLIPRLMMTCNANLCTTLLLWYSWAPFWFYFQCDYFCHHGYLIPLEQGLPELCWVMPGTVSAQLQVGDHWWSFWGQLGTVHGAPEECSSQLMEGEPQQHADTPQSDDPRLWGHPRREGLWQDCAK